MAGQLDHLGSIVLDRASREPLAQQLFAALAARIETGLFPEASRLPTTREVAAALGVNRGSVQTAYRRLVEEGLATTRVGSGTVVRAIARRPRPFDAAELVSNRASAIPGCGSPARVAPGRRRLLAPDPGRAVLPPRPFHRHADRSLEPPAGPVAIRSPARPRGIAGRDLAPALGERHRALPRRDPRDERRAAGPRPALPHVHGPG